VRLENTFEVPAPPEQAWALLNDVPRVIPCMPGAELAETIDDSHWKATMRVKLGPISLQFATDVERTESDEAAHRAVLSAKAREVKGRGGAEATIDSSLAAAGSGSQVTIVTDLTLRGTVAQYGRGIVADVANQLVRRFADCLAGELRGPSEQVSESHVGGTGPQPRPEAPGPAGTRPVEPVGGLGLALGALWRRLKRFLRAR
jgi:carbon monoxide dehydrogenase subunit G